MLQQWLSKVVASPKTATGTASSLLDINQEVDLRATAELVKKYEDNWNSIRATDEINFHNASVVILKL
nr:1560_t:CDS:2 [Entrophospora candida]